MGAEIHAPACLETDPPRTPKAVNSSKGKISQGVEIGVAQLGVMRPKYS